MRLSIKEEFSSTLHFRNLFLQYASQFSLSYNVWCFLKETATDYQILVNVKPYRTDLRILSKEKYSKVSEIPVGVKVQFNESMIISAEYFDCTYCHMPEIPGNNCPSPAKNTVSATGLTF